MFNCLTVSDAASNWETKGDTDTLAFQTVGYPSLHYLNYGMMQSADAWA